MIILEGKITDIEKVEKLEGVSKKTGNPYEIDAHSVVYIYEGKGKMVLFKSDYKQLEFKTGDEVKLEIGIKGIDFDKNVEVYVKKNLKQNINKPSIG
jgi:hypothetical protein